MEQRLDPVALTPDGSDASPDEVRAALDHMLASAAFSRAERPGRFLRHLVQSTLDGQAIALKESTLGCDVFGRPADWDPRLEPIVRQEAARLRKRIAKYYESETDGNASVRISLPVGSYVPRFDRVLPSPLSGPGARPVVEVFEAEPAPPGEENESRRRLSPLYLVVPAILVAVVVLGTRLWQSAQPAASVSLAVLPFQNVTSDPADQYFADGVTDELTDLLGRYASVKTASRAKTAKYKAVTSGFSSVARQLDAQYLVRGSVERSGDLVTIVASLVNGSSGVSVWTNKYRRHGADLTAIEEDLASHLADTLHLGTPVAVQKHVPVAAAHDFFLKGRFEARQTNSAANSRAQADFREALKLDPEYVPAYHGLAQAIWNENIWAGTSPLLSERRKSEELWRKALELDPQYMPALSGLAAYAMQYDWDWLRAERELKAAVAAGDNAGVEENLAVLYLVRGQRAQADAHMQRAKLLDPDGLGRLANEVNVFLLESRFHDAQISCEEWMKRTRNAPGPSLMMAQILAQEGERESALKLLSGLPKDAVGLPMALAQVKAVSGARDEARRMLALLETNYAVGRLFAYDFAVAYAELNDAASATGWMRRSMDAREGPATYIRVDPQLNSVQNSPNFRALKKEMDLDW